MTAHGKIQYMVLGFKPASPAKSSSEDPERAVVLVPLVTGMKTGDSELGIFNVWFFV